LALAARYKCRFILLGRSPRQAHEPAWAAGEQTEAELKGRIAQALKAAGERATPAVIQRTYGALLAAREVEGTLAAVALNGGRAEYVCGDVASDDGLPGLRERLQAAIAAAGGRVTGLIHGAGALSDRLIERKTAEDFARVYETKVVGLDHLLRCMRPSDLRYLVLFSSAAGFFGNPGQSDYAAANEALNRMATLFKGAHPDCRVLAVNWGPWDAGMVTPELRALFDARGVGLIDSARGAEALVELLDGGEGATHVLVGEGLGLPLPAPAPQHARIARRLSLEANPFLRDHVVGGAPVLPAACASVWICNAGAQRYPGYHFFSTDDFRVLKGIVFDETLAAEHVLELRETSRSGGAEGDDEIHLRGVVSSATATRRPRFHYQAEVTLVRRLPAAPHVTPNLREDDHARDGAELYADGTLFHGPLFRGVQRVLNAGPRHLTLRCALPAVDEATQGQFPVRAFNPFLADAQFQSLVIWARLFRAAGSLPLSARRGEHFLPVPSGETCYVTLEVESASEHELVGTTTAHDAAGRVYMRVLGARVTLSERLNSLFRTAAV
jgi:NADP-dependent 3-hydroxy acid dehydrogenase YdfG